jgi:hypothetical protein
MEWLWIFAFSVPAALTLSMPNFRTFAAVTATLGALIVGTWQWRDHVMSAPNYDDSPGDIIVLSLLVAAMVGLICGAGLRLMIFGVNRWLLPRN